MQEAEHHGDRFFKEAAEKGEVQERINKIVSHPEGIANLGATGQFREGTITPDDEGEIRFAVTAESGNVVIAFGKRIQWMAFPPKLALQFADALIHWAKNAKLQTQK